MEFPAFLRNEYDTIKPVTSGKIYTCLYARNSASKEIAFFRFLPDELCSDKTIVDRFLTFFSTYQQVNRIGRRIPACKGVVQREGKIFAHEEFLPGKALTRIAKEKGQNFDSRMLVKIVEEVCEALHFSHQKKVFHACLTPLDILVEENDGGQDGKVAVRLVGFGTAVFAESTALSGITSGIRGHLPPELSRNQPPCPASDIFSLATALRRTFPDLGDRPAIRRAMAPNPADRFQSVREFGETLSKALKDYTPLGAAEATVTNAPDSPDQSDSRTTKKGGLKVLLTVKTDPPGATIKVNGRVAGKATDDGIPVRFEERMLVEAQMDGFRPRAQRVSSYPASALVTLSLDPIIPTSLPIRIITSPPGATIIMDGEDKGMTGAQGLEIPTKIPSTVQIQKAGHQPVVLDIVQVPPKRTIEVTLERFQVIVRTNPIGAEVYLNGELLGEAGPSGLRFPWETGELKVKHEGFAARTMKLTTPPSQNLLFDCDFEQLEKPPPPPAPPLITPTPLSPLASSLLTAFLVAFLIGGGYAAWEFGLKATFEKWRTIGTQPPPPQKMGSLLVNGSIPGVRVSLAGMPKGETGTDGMLLVPNVACGKPLELRLSKEGYEDLKLVITIPEKQTGGAYEMPPVRLNAKFATVEPQPMMRRPQAPDESYIPPPTGITEKQGWTRLMQAAAEGRMALVKVCLEKGEQVDGKSKDGKTPLMVSAENGHLQCVQTLLEAGADLNATSPDGLTPLLAAAEGGHRQIAELLLDKGANVNARRGGQTARGVAYKRQDWKMVDLLKARGGSN